MNRMIFRFAVILLAGATLLLSCNDDDISLEIIAYESTLAQIDPLDKGGRWLANGIRETNELSSLDESQEANITNFLNDLALATDSRCDESTSNAFISDLTTEGYPQEAITIVENAIIRVCSDLNYHEGYWVSSTEIPNVPFPLITINDTHMDAATNWITVYAQTRVNGQVISPPQVGPGECTTLPNGDPVCFHPNAVYLNGSGEELTEGDGTGQWWVKHAWQLGGQGFQNWEIGALEDYGEGMWVEGILLEDGISIQVGDLDNDDTGQYNIREPHLNNDPVSYSVTRYDVNGESDFTVALECTTEVSPFDGLARSCPK